VAHNWGCSFLSLDNFSENGYFVQALADYARDRNVHDLEINILACEISPGQPTNSLVRECLNSAAPSFLRILEAQNCSRQMVKEAWLCIRYESLAPFSKVSEVCSGWSFADPEAAPECVPYSSLVSICDDKGGVVEVDLPRWWER